MAFRDDATALKERIGALTRERDEAHREGEQLREANTQLVESARADAERSARSRRTLPRALGFLGTVGLIAGVAGLVVVRWVPAGDPDGDTLYGRVVEATGSAPVAEGTRCTVFLTPLEQRHDVEDATLDVLCGGSFVYGGAGGGRATCAEDDGPRTRCSDERTDDGDPRMQFERSQRLLRVEGETWRVRIELNGATRSADG